MTWKTNGYVKIIVLLLINILLVVSIISCKATKNNGNGDVNGEGNGDQNDTYDIGTNGIPRFVFTDYIELAKIHLISKFRSGIGHDYSDDFESCRSMKHYFQPKSIVDWASVQIFSPVDGQVTRVRDGWAGAQVHIKSDEYPAFTFILFHVNLSSPLNENDRVGEGQILGTHIGSQTMSDIAIGVHTPNGWKLISYFSVMTDALFQNYQTRGLNTRNGAIISKNARDSDPLTCVGEDFNDSGNLENWISLN